MRVTIVALLFRVGWSSSRLVVGIILRIGMTVRGVICSVASRRRKNPFRQNRNKYKGGPGVSKFTIDGKRSRNFQKFLGDFNMDREAFIKEITDILPVDTDKEGLIEMIKRRSALVRAHDLLTQPLVELYKREGLAGLEVMRYLVDTKLMLADYKEKLESEGVNPLSDPVFQRAHHKIIDAAKLLQDIEDREKDRSLKERELESSKGGWAVTIDDDAQVKVEDEDGKVQD